MIRFFNTLSGKLEEFKPLKAGEVSLYTCGPTVYDYAHIGNYRTFVFEDLLRRFLEFKGYKVKHVMNITDVDDKTIAGANREGKKLEDFTKTYLDAFHEDLKTLNILPPNIKEPRATEQLDPNDEKSIISFIKTLIDKGHAYVNDGSVYFRVASFRDYGNLSGKEKLKGNIQGARVDVDEYEKETGSDFALWKKAKEGEPAWDSPWGKGRPGWHIECSAMSRKYLGDQIDIHAGGEDLIFPHHENEIAQSEALTGKQPFVKYWLHAKHLLVDGKKMSKKDKNYYTLRDLLKMGHDPMVIRFALLNAQYRSALNFTLEGLEAAKVSMNRFSILLAEIRNLKSEKAQNESSIDGILKGSKNEILDALGQDLNAPMAIGVLFQLINKINALLIEKCIAGIDAEKIENFLNEIDKIFGVIEIYCSCEIPSDVIELARERADARKRKEFEKADKFRQQIKDRGFDIEDTPQGDRLRKL